MPAALALLLGTSLAFASISDPDTPESVVSYSAIIARIKISSERTLPCRNPADTGCGFVYGGDVVEKVVGPSFRHITVEVDRAFATRPEELLVFGLQRGGERIACGDLLPDHRRTPEGPVLPCADGGDFFATSKPLRLRPLPLPDGRTTLVVLLHEYDFFGVDMKVQRAEDGALYLPWEDVRARILEWRKK